MTEHAFSQQVGTLVRKLFGLRDSGRSAAVAQGVLAGQNAAALAPQVIATSKLQLIGLERVRTILGDRWPKLAERVCSIAQGIVEKNLLPGDVCEPYGDHGFLVLFAQLSPSDARFKSDAICKQIERHLIGANLGQVSECSAEIQLVDRGGEMLDQPNERSDDPAAALSTSSEPFPLRRATDRPIGAVTDRREARSNTDTSALTQAAVAPAAGAQDSQLPQKRRHTDMEWAYTPVWNFQQASLIMFALHICRPEQSGDGAPSPDCSGERLSDIDTAAVAKGVADLTALWSTGRRLPLLMQIHHGTIDNARRRAFFSERLKTIPQEFRKLISFEIVGCPSGGLNQGLAGAIQAIKSLGMRVAMRVDPNWPDFLELGRCGVHTATMNANDLDLPENERMIAFEIFSARASNAKLECGMWGISTRSMVVAAASNGIRYLAGPAIAPDVASLSHGVRFSPIDLYSRQ